jgi:triacylglycerol lipase
MKAGRSSRISRRMVIAVIAGVTMLSSGAGAADSATPPPVLLVHGFRGSPGAFDTMAARLTRAGREVHAIALPGQDNIVNARAIRDFAAAHHLRRVDVVAHSMGGLSSRWFVRYLRGRVSVAHYVALGTPQYGLWATCPAPPDHGGQMCPDGAFLSKLNRGDDTPGTTKYTSISSTDDGLVPVSSSRLDGGACLVRDRGVTHGRLLSDARVYKQVVQSLNGRCPPAFD